MTIGLFTAFDALPPHPPYPLPELGGVLRSPDVYEQVSKEGDLDVQFADHLKEAHESCQESYLVHSHHALQGKTSLEFDEEESEIPFFRLPPTRLL